MPADMARKTGVVGSKLGHEAKNRGSGGSEKGLSKLGVEVSKRRVEVVKRRVEVSKRRVEVSKTTVGARSRENKNKKLVERMYEYSYVRSGAEINRG